MSTNITPPSLPQSGASDDAVELPVLHEKKRPHWQWVEPLTLLSPAGLWLLLLLVLPTLVIFELSLVPNIKPGMVVNPSGIENYCLAFGFAKCNLANFDPTNLWVMARSLYFAVGTMLICLLLGFPVAYWIAQMTAKRWRNLLLLGFPVAYWIAQMTAKRWRNLLLLGFILPLWTSSLLRSYAWITILRPTGVINTILNTIGLPSVEILNTGPAVLVGMAYSYLPYMVLILYASLEKLDKRLLEASADLGANPIQTFWKVTVPQTLPGIAAGSLLVFISGLGDFVDPELLGGASSMTGARLIYNQFLGPTQNWGFGSALSMVLIAAVSIAIALLIKYGDREATAQR